MEKSAISCLKSKLSLEHILLLVYLIVGYALFDKYFQSGLTKYLGFLLFPYITVFEENRPPNKLYPLFAIALIGLSFLIYAQSLYFLAFVFTFLFILENAFGRLNILPVFYIVVLSTIFQYFITIFTVPIRLELSALAGKLINLIGFESHTSGNMIHWGNQAFAVDTACIGLNMLAISFILTLFFLAHFERENKVRLSFISICGFLFIALLLNIFSNLMRIIILVIFNILPENKMHDVVGLLCLGVYVLLPSYFLTKFAVGKYAQKFVEKKIETPFVKNKLLRFFPLLMLLCIPAKYFNTKQSIENQKVRIDSVQISGFEKEIILDVGKFTKENTLLYIKPIKSFFAAEHNPMICWIGSGYELKEIRQENWQGREIYTGELVKNGNKIYTAWWYEAANRRTIRQIEWRWEMLKSGQTYYLMNMNTATKENLKRECELISPYSILSN